MFIHPEIREEFEKALLESNQSARVVRKKLYTKHKTNQSAMMNWELPMSYFEIVGFDSVTGGWRIVAYEIIGGDQKITEEDYHYGGYEDCYADTEE